MLKVQIAGNIGSDPEMRYSAQGTPLLSFSVASNGRTRSTKGEWQDTTRWVHVTVFGQRAETLHQHLTRGTRVYRDGRLEARPWIDRSKEPRAGLELAADTGEFVSSRRAPDLDISELADGPICASVSDGSRQPVSAGSGYQSGAADLDLEDAPF